MKEISIIAPNIKNGGGRELLEYLLREKAMIKKYIYSLKDYNE